MDMYMQVRVLFTIILGLGVSRLLRGVARIVQHPKEYKVYWVHLLWSLFVFLYFDSFLVVGISSAGDSAVDVPSLFLYLHVRGDSISAVRAVVPGRDG